MTQPIRIGFLSPYSSIYPGMVPGTISGFYSGIPEANHGLFHVVPEYIGQGGEKTVLEAVHKLIGFHRVDMLAGVISYRSLPALVPAIEKHGRPALFFDAGEYLPYPHPLSDSVFCNSFQLWQSQFALGEWAHREFGEKGAVVMPIYDAGYHLQSAFRQGTVMAGAETLDLHILPYQPGGSQVTAGMGAILSAVESAKASFVHAVFCGTEAREFLNAFYQSGLQGKIPLIVTNHMASRETLEEMANLNLKFYSASMWSPHSKERANVRFYQNVRDFAHQEPDFYTLLGYEAGLLFSELIPEFKRRDWDAVTAGMKQGIENGPRGPRSFCMAPSATCPNVNIEKIDLGQRGVQSLVIGQGTALPFNHAIYETIHRENVSGWQNPYLCV